MADPEKGFFVPQQQEFQPVIGYREPEKSPPLVVRQTHTLLELFYRGAIRNPEPARDYFRNYTIEYLKEAAEGVDILYNQAGQLITHEIDLETREAAGYSFIILANLPDRATSTFLPNGFSRRGMLQAPETKGEFLARIRELRVGLWLVAIGEVEPHATLEAYPSLSRTFQFFKVGSDLPIKSTEDERKQEMVAREEFNDLLGGIDISFA